MSLTPSQSISICSGSSGTFQINGNLSSITFFPLLGLNNNNRSFTVNPSTSQTYTIIGGFNSCTIIRTLQVGVLPLPVAKITASKTVICLNNLLELNGSGGSIYSWSSPAGFVSNQQNLSTIISSTASAGFYKLTVTDLNGCKNSSSINISISPVMGGELKGLKMTGCAPLCSEYRFEKIPLQASVVSNWQIENQNYSENFQHCFANAGSYQIRGILTDTQTSCTADISYSVEVLPSPKANFWISPENPLAEIDEVKFINSSTGENQVFWSWNFTGSEADPAITSAYSKDVVNHFGRGGVYVAALVVIDTKGCADTIIKRIFVEEDIMLFVPNSFTPNGDQLNDIFLPIAKGVNILTLKIFDRWGKKIFESQTIGEGWDGKYNGEAVPDGNYVWTIVYSSDNKKTGSRTGQIMIKN
jgi:gliding motility-associated-like protein